MSDQGTQTTDEAMTIHYDKRCRYCDRWATVRETATYPDGRVETDYYCSRCKSAF